MPDLIWGAVVLVVAVSAAGLVWAVTAVWLRERRQTARLGSLTASGIVRTGQADGLTLHRPTTHCAVCGLTHTHWDGCPNTTKDAA